jgi:uncharacterized membrane protein YhiD involved in acid resistance
VQTLLHSTPLQVQIFGSVALARLLGAAIGLDRESKERRRPVRLVAASGVGVALAQILLAVGGTGLVWAALRELPYLRRRLGR